MFIFVILGYVVAIVLASAAGIEIFEQCSRMEQGMGVSLFFGPLSTPFFQLFAAFALLGLIQIAKFLEELVFMGKQQKLSSATAPATPSPVPATAAPVAPRKKSKPEAETEGFFVTRDTPPAPKPAEEAPLAAPEEEKKESEEEKRARIAEEERLEKEKNGGMSFFHLNS